MSNSWSVFAVKEKEGGNFNSAVSGGKFLGLGTHKVTIDEVEQRVTKTGSPFLKFVFTNSEGQSINGTVFLHFNYQGDTLYSKKYKEFGAALCPVNTTKYKFFNIFLPNNPHFLPSLVGMTLNIDVTKATKGFTIEKMEGETYVLVDVASGLPLSLDDGIPNSFDSYKDAAAAGRDVRVNGDVPRRAFNEVTQFSAANDADKNADAIELILADAAKQGSL